MTDLSALRQCRLFSSGDIAEAHEHVSAALQPHVLVPLGRNEGRVHHLDRITLPGVGINAVAFGHARIAVPPLDDYHAVIFCLAGTGALRCGEIDAEVGPRNAVLCRAGAPIEGQFSTDCEQMVIRIDRAALQSRLGPRSSLTVPVTRLGDPSTRPWRAHLDTLMNSPELLRLLRADDRLAARYADLLLMLLLADRDHPATNERQGPVPAIVHRAEAFIAARSAEPITLDDVAGAARAPVRTLLYAFRRFRGVSPMQHLRNVRLDTARGRLMRCPLDGIATVALDCGFANLGRFSRDYAERFAELPSETRRAVRLRSARS